MIMVQCVIGSQLSRQQPSGGLRPQSVSSLCILRAATEDRLLVAVCCMDAVSGCVCCCCGALS